MNRDKSDVICKDMIFPSSGSVIKCPVCGFPAKVINTDAAFSWAEIDCDNCSTYAIQRDALLGTRAENLPFLSGYYRHVWNQPMTIQCDSKLTVEDHIEKTRQIVTRKFQTKMLLGFYYQKDIVDRLHKQNIN